MSRDHEHDGNDAPHSHEELAEQHYGLSATERSDQHDERDLQTGERSDALTERDLAVAERAVVAEERAERDEEKRLAQAERMVASGERTQARQMASDERVKAADERRTSRVDIAALAVEVGHLGASVQDLHDLILDSLVKSETAIVEAQASPSKGRVYGLVGLSALLALALGAGGLLTARELRQQAEADRDTLFANCETRNAAQRADAAFVLTLADAARRSAGRGDLFAADVVDLLSPRTRPILVDCSTFTRR
jgi:hypothetical protein